MKKYFNPSWIVCMDENMVIFHNPFTPGWVAVKRKSQPLGNKYRTVACAQFSVIFFVEIVEGTDWPSKRPYKVAHFENELKSKISAIVVQMT